MTNEEKNNDILLRFKDPEECLQKELLAILAPVNHVVL